MSGPTPSRSGLIARPYTADDQEAWNELAAAARARHFMFQRRYMDYHADRFTDASLIVLRGGRPCTLSPATHHSETIISHGSLTFGGLLSGPEQTLSRTLEAFPALTEVLRSRRIPPRPQATTPSTATGRPRRISMRSTPPGATLASGRRLGGAVANSPRTSGRGASARGGARTQNRDGPRRDGDIEAFIELVASRPARAPRHDAYPHTRGDAAARRRLPQRYPAVHSTGQRRAARRDLGVSDAGRRPRAVIAAVPPAGRPSPPTPCSAT